MKLFVSSSPHIRHSDSTIGIMLDVILALVPVGIASIVMHGFNAVLLIAVCIASAVASEYLWCKAIKKQTSLLDLSAVVTGLILAFNLPATLPFWMAVIGSLVDKKPSEEVLEIFEKATDNFIDD
mgnify:CR=1 FL=1